MNTNISNISTLFHLSSDEERIETLNNDIMMWEERRKEYWEELDELRRVPVGLYWKIRKNVCISGLRATNEWIGQALNELEEIEKGGKEEREKWLLLEEIELSFK